MRPNKKVMTGALLLFMMMAANFHNALNDYGIRSNAFMNGVIASGSEGSGSAADKTVLCRKVGCKDKWEGTTDINGCIPFFGKRICLWGASLTVTYPYFGKKENCTEGSDWEDCNACQTDCVPEED